MSESKSQLFFLRNPDFAKVWLGQILSQSCGRMFQMAMVWWILKNYLETGGRYIGAFMVMAALPSLLFAKAIGSRIDQSSSRKVLIRSDLAAFFTLLIAAALLYSEQMVLPVLFVLAFVAALFQAFIDPTLNKSVAEVVEEKDVEEGVGFLAATQSIASFSGAILGASLIDSLGISGTIALASFGYLVSSLSTYLANFKPNPNANSLESKTETGWAVLKEQPLLKRIVLGFAAVNFFATPTLVVLPVYVKRVLGASAQTLGLLEAGLWVGLILGALVAKKIQGDKLRVGSVCISIFGLALAVPGIVTSFAVYWVALFFAGLSLGINNAKFMNFFQESVPAALKGRFFALMQALLGCTFPIAYFLFGVLTDVMNPGLVCLIQGGGVVLLSGYFFYLSSEKPKDSLMGGIA